MSKLRATCTLVILTGAALASTVGGPARGQGGPRLEEPVGRVGEVVLQYGMLQEYLLRYYGKGALERLIDESLLRQEGVRYKLTTTEPEIDARVQEVTAAARGGAPPVALLREQARYDLLTQKVLDAKWPVRDADLTRLQVRYARVKTQQQAKDLIREARRGVNFEQLVLQESLDKENGGLVNNGPFMKVENPPLFRLASDANLRPGQITPQPVSSGEFWLVIKLENQFGPETLTGKARTDAIARIRGFRLAGLRDALRKRYRADLSYPTSLEEVRGRGDATPTAVLARHGKEATTFADLQRRLVRYFGPRALEQLIDRSVISQEAARLKITVADSEADERVAALRKATGVSGFQTVLAGEGITERDWKERIRFNILAEKVLATRFPAAESELSRYSIRYVRVRSRAEADAILQAARAGAPFEQLLRRSLDQSGEGYLRPRAFLRSDQPIMYEALEKANAEPGQFLSEPLLLVRTWWVIRVESRQGPETLTAQERLDAARRINARKLDSLLDETRKSYRIERSLPAIQEG